VYYYKLLKFYVEQKFVFLLFGIIFQRITFFANGYLFCLFFVVVKNSAVGSQH